MEYFHMDFITFILTLFIPLAIVYFQERSGMMERFLDFSFSVRRVSIEVAILISLTWLAGLFDLLDLPSRIFHQFVGQQEKVEFILSIFGMVVLAEQLRFYIDYFSFKTLQYDDKVSYLFNRIHKKLARFQVSQKWSTTNQIIISKYQPNDFLYRKAIACTLGGRKSGTILRFTTDQLSEFSPKVLLLISCGSFVQPKSIVAYIPEGEEDIREKLTKTIQKNIRIGSNPEERMYELLRVAVTEIQREIAEGSLLRLERSLYSLLGCLVKLGNKNFIITRPHELLHDLYLFFRQSMDGGDATLQGILKSFNASLLVSIARTSNEEYTEGMLSLCLDRTFIDLDDHGILNDGFIYLTTEVLRSLLESGVDSRRLIYKLCQTCLELLALLEPTEIDGLRKQVEEKEFILSEATLKPYSLALLIPFAFIKKEQVIYVELPQSTIDVFVKGLFVRNDQIVKFLNELQITGYADPKGTEKK